MKLSKSDILNLADLAKLELSSQEIETYRSQLTEVLAYVEKINKLDLDKIPESLSGVTETDQVLRLDQAVAGEPAVFTQAQQNQAGFLVAPNVFKK